MILVGTSGPIPMLVEIVADNELDLQERLKANAGLLPIEEFGWSGPLMVVGRETRLPSGAVDLIGVTPSGEILVAEFKTGPQNTDFRGAIAQAVDYGADLWQMTLEQFESAVALPYFASKHCPPSDPAHGMKSLGAAAQATWADGWAEDEQDQFSTRIESALKAGRIHYAVVAQRFTPAMERTVRYLNEISSGPRFFLVELIKFGNETYQAYEARTVVKPDAHRGGSGMSGKIDLEKLLSMEPNESYRNFMHELLEFCEAQSLTFQWGSSGLSIRVQGPDRPEPVSIGWLFPSTVKSSFAGLRAVSLGYPVQHAAAGKTFGPALHAYIEAARKLPGALVAAAKKVDAVILSPDDAMGAKEAVKMVLAQVAAAANQAV